MNKRMNDYAAFHHKEEILNLIFTVSYFGLLVVLPLVVLVHKLRHP